MFVKKYIAKDMPDAMEQIRRELGSEAVILSNKLVRQKGITGIFKRKLLEVTVAYDTVRTVEKKSKETEVPKANTKAEEEKINQLNDKLLELKFAMEAFTEKIAAVDKETSIRFTPEVLSLYNKFIAHDVNEGLAKRIADRVQDICVKQDCEPNKVAEDILAEIIGDPAELKIKKYTTNIIMLVGATGVGKTTTIVKLAAMYAIEQGLKVGFINTDTFRVAAQEQIKTYSDIMNIPLYTIYSPEEMKDALKALGDRDIVLIDTAGKNTSSPDYKKQIEDYIEVCKTDEILLVISASTGAGACRELINNHKFLNNYKIIITKLDEISVWGNVANIADFAKMPLAFITAGQNVPYDIELPDLPKIVKNILESV